MIALKRVLNWNNLRQVAFYGFFMVAIMTAFGWYMQRDMPSGRAPEISAMQLDGTPAAWPLSKDQPSVIYFWASWCAWCRIVGPSVSAIAEDYPVQTVALTSGSDAAIQRYLRHYELEFPVINDHQGEIAQTYGVKTMPSILILDRKGDVRYITTGYTSYLGMRLRLWLASFS